MSGMGPTIVLIGLIVVAIGALVWLGVPIGRLPGDIVIRRDNFSFYFPITTAILVSLALTAIGMLFRR